MFVRMCLLCVSVHLAKYLKKAISCISFNAGIGGSKILYFFLLFSLEVTRTKYSCIMAKPTTIKGR